MPKRLSQGVLANRLSAWEGRRLVQGEQLHRQGNFYGAMKKYRALIDRNPKCWPAVFNASVLAHQICEHDWAIHWLTKAVTAEPGFQEAWYNLGTILQTVNRYQEAADALERAVALDPTASGALVNLGNAYLGLGRLGDAFVMYDRALQHKPQNPEAVWNLAHYLIMTGQWEKGWTCYEARWAIVGFTELNQVLVDASRPDAPRHWPDGADLTGKTLIVTEEQGYGDLFMCLRYAPMLRAMGARTIWAVRPECMRLVAASLAPDQVVSIRDAVPAGDYLVSCMSLHQRLRVTPDTVPGAEGYLLP